MTNVPLVCDLFLFYPDDVTVSLMLKDREMILPEMAAMAIAMWVYREAGWSRQPPKIFLASLYNSCDWFCGQPTSY